MSLYSFRDLTWVGGQEKKKTNTQTGGHSQARIRWTALSDKETSAHWKLNGVSGLQSSAQEAEAGGSEVEDYLCYMNEFEDS